MTPRFRHLSVLASTLVLLVPLSGCTRVGTTPGRGGPEPADVAPSVPEGTVSVQRFTGYATLSGRRVPVALEVRTSPDGQVEGVLEIPEMEVRALGSGSWNGERLSLRLGYGDGCSGTAKVDVSGEGSDRLVGTLAAGDCTGSAEGPLELRGGDRDLDGLPAR